MFYRNAVQLTYRAVGSYHRVVRRPDDSGTYLRIWRAVRRRGSDRGLVAVRTPREGSDLRGLRVIF